MSATARDIVPRIGLPHPGPATAELPCKNRFVFEIELSNGAIRTITETTDVATLARDGVTASADRSPNRQETP
ncbi:MAG: hypothetical protein AAF390_14790 [Pseudomonadota bacterium]